MNAENFMYNLFLNGLLQNSPLLVMMTVLAWTVHSLKKDMRHGFEKVDMKFEKVEQNLRHEIHALDNKLIAQIEKLNRKLRHKTQQLKRSRHH